MNATLAQRIGSLLAAMENCGKSGNAEWFGIHNAALNALTREHLPSGSGFDSGSELDMDRSKPDKLVFSTAFHHMNECGMYDGWTEHTITARPSFVYGIELTIGGRDRNGIKEYISQAFDMALSRTIPDSEMSHVYELAKR